MLCSVCKLHNFVFIVLMQFFVAFNAQYTFSQCPDQEQCLLKINERTIDNVMMNVRLNADPCSNFWSYACGGWATVNARSSYLDNFDIVEDYHATKLRSLLETLTDFNESATPNLWQQLRAYYGACKSNELHMMYYLKSLPDAFKWHTQMLQGDLSTFNWLRATAQLRRYGLNGVFIDESVGVAYNDSLTYAVQLNMPDENVYLTKKNELLHYMLEFGLIEHITSDNENLASGIFDLEMQLRALSIRYRTNEPIEETLSLASLKLKIPQIDWQMYFDVLLDAGVAPSHLRVEVADIEYLQQVGMLLQRTEQRVVGGYLLMRLCKYLLDLRPPSTDKRCVTHMAAMLPLGMDYLYETYSYRRERLNDEPILQAIFTQLKETFKHYLAANTLHLKPLELRYVTSKLQEMRLQLGTLPATRNAAWYDEHYRRANITADNFYQNHLQMLLFRTSYQHELLLAHDGHLQLDTYYVNDDRTEVRNAPFFMHQRNLLIVPLNFMHLPFFHQRQDALFQYSLMGWILAHELNHAFELEGIIFDAAGNEATTGFAIQKAATFVAAHACLNRSATAALKERVADVNGFQLVYDTFFNASISINSYLNNDELMYSTSFSARQLFYLNFAQFFCGTLPTPIEHDRDDVRVNVVVANAPDFAEVFKCDAHQQWPTNKQNCQMWRPSNANVAKT